MRFLKNREKQATGVLRRATRDYACSNSMAAREGKVLELFGDLAIELAMPFTEPYNGAVPDDVVRIYSEDLVRFNRTPQPAPPPRQIAHAELVDRWGLEVMEMATSRFDFPKPIHTFGRTGTRLSYRDDHVAAWVVTVQKIAKAVSK